MLDFCERFGFAPDDIYITNSIYLKNFISSFVLLSVVNVS